MFKRNLRLSDSFADTIVSYRANLLAQLAEISTKQSSAKLLGDLDNQSIMLRLRSSSSDQEQSEITIESALKNHHHILIFGPPGSGKSTLLKLIALNAARGLLRGVSNIPVLLSLHNFDTTKRIEEQIRDEIETRANTYHTTITGLTKSLEEGQVLLLLDGLNETADIETVIHELTQFSFKFPRMHIVVTSRQYAVMTEFGFTTFEIAPLTKNETRQLIDIWYADSPNSGEVFWNIIESSPGLSSLASNPFLLRLISDLYQGRKNLPEDRGALQERYIKTFLSFIFKDLSTLARQLAEDIAFFMHITKKTFLSQDELTTRLRDLAEAWKQTGLENHLASLLKLNILYQPTLSQYQFSHLVLQEQFCTQALQRLDKGKLLELVGQYAGDSWWDSVFTQLAKHEPNVNDMILALVTKGDASHWLLAAKFLTEGAQVKEDLRIRTVRNLCELLDQDNPDVAMKASNILVELKEPKVDDLCYSLLQEKSNDHLAVASLTYVLAARGRTGKEFYRFLRNTLRDENTDVRFQACRALGALDTEFSTEILIGSLRSEKDTRVLQQALSSLCRGNIPRKVSSSSQAQLLVELAELKQHTPDNSEEVRSWIRLLERKLVAEPTSSNEA